MNKEDLIRRIESMKGLAGTGNILGEILNRAADCIRTLEPGDYANTISEKVSAAPVGYDLWYLFYHQNFMKKYYKVGTEQDNKDNYVTYLNDKLSFLNTLTGLKPLKVLTDLSKELQAVEREPDREHYTLSEWEKRWENLGPQWKNNGIYWINSIFFELIVKNKHIQYPSDGSAGYRTSPNNYVGYITFPIGQLGVMEVISLFQEIDLRGYKFTKVDSLPTYHAKPPISDLQDQYKPSLQSTPSIFPDMKDSNGNALAGQNYCYGRHLIESAYLMPETLGTQQNAINSDSTTAYAPVANRDFELWSSDIKDYGEDIKPKLWCRYWIHKDSTMPVPGEFIGILVRPVACPPHVWWFQESAPFLYAGNWMETGNLTSGIVTEVTLETARTDGGTGDLYKVKIQGCEILVTASDFLRYSVGDRVAIMKVHTTATSIEKSFTANNQTHLKDSDSYTMKPVINADFIIVPCTFFKKII